MGSELQFPFFDNLSLGELELDITLGVKTREVLGSSLVICFSITVPFLFSFPLMTAEQFAKNAADDQSSVLRSVIFLCSWKLPGANANTYSYRVPNRLQCNMR